MHKIYLDLSDALEYIKESFEDAVIKGQDIKNARYHHNSVYQNAPSIVKYGLLSLNGIYRKGIKDFSKEILALSDDISSHVNGNDGISLSVVGLTDLYKDEDEYALLYQFMLILLFLVMLLLIEIPLTMGMNLFL